MNLEELRKGSTVEQGTIKSFYEHGVHVGMGKCYKFSELNPKPFRKEMLLKRGFKEDIEDDSFRFEEYGVSVNDDGECLFLLYTEVGSYIELAEFKYLHQFQNLCFVLIKSFNK